MRVSYQLYDTAGGPPQLLFTSDNIQSLVVTNFLISSSNGAQVTCSVYLVPPSVVAFPVGLPQYAVLNGYKLAANSFIEGHGGFVVPAGRYKVYVSTDTGNAAVYNISGVLGANVLDVVVT